MAKENNDEYVGHHDGLYWQPADFEPPMAIVRVVNAMMDIHGTNAQVVNTDDGKVTFWRNDKPAVKPDRSPLF